ncbi:hypothetical protein CPC08DRAFT_817433 [Agrocybe pediades]|nr:hypothetical protein CPC08DRAFT_817433 [Agrocybe pediades]
MPSVPQTPLQMQSLERSYSPVPEGRIQDPDNDFIQHMRRIRKTKNAILEWNKIKQCLVPMHIPVDDDNHVVPFDKWEQERQATIFRFPACFCSTQVLEGPQSIESAVYCVRSGGLFGQWVAQCAQRVCTYHAWNTRAAAKRSLPSTPTVSSTNNHAVSLGKRKVRPAQGLFSTPPSSQPAKRQRVEKHSPSTSASQGASSSPTAGPITGLWTALKRAAPPSPDKDDAVSDYRKLMRLDSQGLSYAQFFNTVVVCYSCENWIGTQFAFQAHACPRKDVIDLTLTDN